MQGRARVAMGGLAITAVGITYILILVHPEPLFSRRIDRGDFTVYARKDVGNGDTSRWRSFATWRPR